MKSFFNLFKKSKHNKVTTNINGLDTVENKVDLKQQYINEIHEMERNLREDELSRVELKTIDSELAELRSAFHKCNELKYNVFKEIMKFKFLIYDRVINYFNFKISLRYTSLYDYKNETDSHHLDTNYINVSDYKNSLDYNLDIIKYFAFTNVDYAWFSHENKYDLSYDDSGLLTILLFDENKYNTNLDKYNLIFKVDSYKELKEKYYYNFPLFHMVDLNNIEKYTKDVTNKYNELRREFTSIINNMKDIQNKVNDKIKKKKYYVKLTIDVNNTKNKIIELKNKLNELETNSNELKTNLETNLTEINDSTELKNKPNELETNLTEINDSTEIETNLTEINDSTEIETNLTEINDSTEIETNSIQ
jgi:hypothetical protein